MPQGRSSRRSRTPRSPWSKSSLQALWPTYPMIPHTPKPPLEREMPGCSPGPSSGRSAELSSHESGGGTTGLLGLSLRFGLGQDADHGLGPGRAHEHTAAAVEARVQAVHGLEQGFWKLLVRDADVFPDLREVRHDGRRSLQSAA